MDVSHDELSDRAIVVLKTGGVIVLPTETAYGLAADATNAEALDRVIAIKGRDAGKTPPLIVATIEMAEYYMVLPPLLRALADRYWPGPLTIVGKAKGTGLSKQVIHEDGTIAVRVSSHPIARQLSLQLGLPIVATSANLSGESACYSAEDVRKQFEHQRIQPDFYVDMGIIPFELPSTLVKEEEGKIVVLRQGSIHLE
ncbi:MAG: L-threonylcarbamoyladenylate synthase [Candidatus Uhrbacteria bacterium]|nr:L-threonylcarbamoyladenylate synthase [Candidatus Uhrbacteria bacterium]